MNPNSQYQRDNFDGSLGKNSILVEKNKLTNVNLEQSSGSFPTENLSPSQRSQNATIRLDVNTKEPLDSNFYIQTRALIRKNASMQWKMKGTNCCQVFTLYLLK